MGLLFVSLLSFTLAVASSKSFHETRPRLLKVTGDGPRCPSGFSLYGFSEPNQYACSADVPPLPYGTNTSAYSPLYALAIGSLGFYWPKGTQQRPYSCPQGYTHFEAPLDLNPTFYNKIQEFCLIGGISISPRQTGLWMYSYFWPHGGLGYGFKWSPN